MTVHFNPEFQIDPTQIRRYCHVLYDYLDGYAVARFISEKGTPSQTPQSEFAKTDNIADLIVARSAAAARERRAVFVVPGSLDQATRAKAEDIRSIGVVLVDLDECDVDTAAEILSTALGPPSLIVASGGTNALGQPKKHLYWRLTEPASGRDLKGVSALQARLAAAVNGDTSFASLHQPIRVPGTIHGKNGQLSPVRILADTGLEYELDDLIERAKHLEISESPQQKKPMFPGLPVPSPHLTAADLASMPIHEGSVDEVTRFEALSKVIGHYIRLVRMGRITLDEAWLAVCEHNAAMIRPPWEETRLRREFDAILKKDKSSHTDFAALADEVHVALIENSDDALAAHFVAQHKDKFKYVSSWKRWYVWDGNRWAHDETSRARDEIRLVCRDVAARCEKSEQGRRIASDKTISAAFRIASCDPGCASAVDVWDQHPHLLNTPGGTIDLTTGEDRDNRPEDRLTQITRVSLGQGCQRWLAFLDRITGGDQELQAYLARIAGYCLTGETREQVFFFFHGDGGNGKSVFVQTLSHVMGDYASIATETAFMATRSQQHLSELAGLRAARLVVMPETEAGQKWAEARIKSVTGGEPVRANFMHRDHFEFLPQFKLIVVGNHRPELTSLGESMRRRLHLVEFNVTIPEQDRDKYLDVQLRNEAEGILGWMLDGCHEWQRIGLSPPESVLQAVKAYISDEDLVGQWLEDRCELEPAAWCDSKSLFSSWASWCEAEGRQSGTSKALGEALRQRGLKSQKRSGQRGWTGIALKRPHVSSEVAA